MLARISGSACDLSLKEKRKNRKELKGMEKWKGMDIHYSEWKGMDIHYSEWKEMEKTGKEHSEISHVLLNCRFCRVLLSAPLF